MAMIDPEDLPREARTGAILHPDLGTHAHASYHATTTSLNALLAFVLGQEHDSATEREDLARRRKSVDEAFSGPWAIDVAYTTLTWQVAMRVAAVEVYLQDALTFLAVYDAEFMQSRGSEQTWRYADIRGVSDADATLWAFCERWAKAFIGDGGPARWASALERAGLGQFRQEDVIELEAMWGYRHMRIHNGGRFSPDFVRRHRPVAERIWRDGLRLSDVQKWIETANAFVAAAEQGIAGRLRARLGTELIEERERIRFDGAMPRLEDEFRAGLKKLHPEYARRLDEAAADPDRQAWYSIVHELLALTPLPKVGTEGEVEETPTRKADQEPA